MTDELTESIAKYGKASVEGGLSKPTSSLPKPPKQKLTKAEKRAKMIADGEAVRGLSVITYDEPDPAIASLLAAIGQHQSHVGLVPTIPPKEPPQPKPGRATTINSWPPSMFSTLFTLLMEGYPLNRICMRDDMPAATTICTWAVENSAFYERYRRARDIGLVRRADNLRDELATHPDPVRAKLLFDHDKWYLAKMMPKTYGERSELHTTQTIEHKHVIDVSQLTPEAMEALEGALIEAKALPGPTQDVVTRASDTEDST